MIKRPKNVADKLIRWVGTKNSILIHTVFFAFMFGLVLFGIDFDKILLVLTTIVSLEAIYLAIFIQITVNRHSEDLVEVSEDIEEIQEDIDEIQEDVDEIQEDIDEIQEDVDEISEDEETLDDHGVEMKKLEHIENTLQTLLTEISELKKK